jgi:hypothetical protein
VTGSFALDSFRVRLKDGGEIQIDKEKVKSIVLRKRLSETRGVSKTK